MKRLIIYISIIFIALSCNKDKGNYKYSDINDVKIEGIEDSYSMLAGVENLKISPVVKGTKEGAQYEYKWQFAPSESAVGPVISTEKDLDWPVDLAKGSYALYFKVKDVETGLEYKTYTMLNISYAFTRGYLLACEDKDGFFQLDMIAMPGDADTVVMSNLLKQDGAPKIKGAQNVYYTGQASPSQAATIKLWVIGENEGYWVDPEEFTFTDKNNFKNMVFTSRKVPADFAVTTVAPVAPDGRAASYRFMRGNNGWIFLSMLMSNGDFYANPVNFIPAESKEPFNTSPYLMYTLGYLSGIVAYDTDNERFVSMGNFNANMSKLADGASDVFPWNNKDVGRTLKFAENTRNKDGGNNYGNSFALMYEKANPQNHWIYKFMATSRAAKQGAYEIKNDIAKDFSKAELFTFASSRTILMYAVNDKLYAYDYNKNSERLKEIDFGNKGDKITMIKFNAQLSGNINELFVATCNASGEGTLRILTLDTANPDDIIFNSNERAVWTGLAKVKDINWRNN